MKKVIKNSAKIILITGAPAAGKFTVGKKLSKKLNIPLLHNHIVIDLVKELFPNEKKKNTLRKPLFLDLLTFAAKNHHSLILTYAYAENYSSGKGLNDRDPDLVKTMKRISESFGGQFFSVHLIASDRELLNRIDAPSRKKFHKLKNRTEMRNILKQWNVVTPPPFKDCLVIDNSKISADKTVRIILDKWKN